MKLIALTSLLAPAAVQAQTMQQDSGQFLLQPRSLPSLLGPDLGLPTRRVHGVKYKVNRLNGENTAKPRGINLSNVSPTCRSPQLSYFGGPVISNVQPVAVFWNSNVNSQLTAPTTGIAQFLADVGSSTFFNVLAEYSTFGGLADGTDQFIGNGSSSVRAITLVPSKCAGAGNCTLDDIDIQNELNAQITAGNLPAPTYDSEGNANTVYMTYFPPNVTVNGPDGSGASCVEFCAYHNTGLVGSSTNPLVYGVLMDEFSTTCSEGCGENATAMENMTDTSSHELAESITDADVGLDTAEDYAYPAAWGDNNNNCGEIADICDTGAAGDTITVSGRSWNVQELWSNSQENCTSTGIAAVHPYFLASPGTALAGFPLNFALTALTPSGGTYTGYTGTVHFTSSDPSATLPADYTYVAGDAGVHTFQATLKTGTTQTISATDASHSTLTATAGISITQPEPAAITSPTPGSTLTGSSETFQWSAGLGVTQYALGVGTTGVGSYNLYNSGYTAAVHATVTDLPTTGGTIYVRLYSLINGVWQSSDYTYTAYNPLAALTSPAPGSTLTGSGATFQWSAGVGVTQYVLGLGTTGVGSYNLYNSGYTTELQASVTGLPTNGATIYARLFSKVNGAWLSSDYTYSAFNADAALISPTPGSVLAGSSVTFNWSAGTGATQYVLGIGTTGVGSYNLFNSGYTTAQQASATGLPTNGETLYARLYSKINGSWQSNDYTYTAYTPLAVLTSPAPGSRLAGSSATFNWSAGTGVTQYVLGLGTTGVGSYNLFNSGYTTAQQATATGLPTTGGTIYARLFSKINGSWQSNDYTYAAYTPLAVLISPQPGSTLASTSVTFQWSSGAGVTEYVLGVGNTGVGSYNLYNSGYTTALQASVTGLPSNGGTVNVRLYSKINGAWQYNDYIYTAE